MVRIAASVLVVTIPIFVYARNNGGGTLLPSSPVEIIGNSQNMALLAAPRNSNPLSIGGSEIAIADGKALESSGARGEVFVESGKSGTSQISVYVVRKGDTLSEIAEMFGVSTNTIVWANDLRGSTIREGQELVILPISGVRHTVKSGETLQSIAKNYKADIEDILSYNDLSLTSKIKANDIIIIPNGVISAPVRAVAGATSRTINSSLPTYSGYYLRPVAEGRKSQGIHGNNGVDLAAPVGTPVMAAAGGRVIVSRTGGYNGGYGTYIVISHGNGTQTLYAHLSANNVSVGQEVSQGQVIGSIGMTGRTTGPHLHFEVRGARNPF